MLFKDLDLFEGEDNECYKQFFKQMIYQDRASTGLMLTFLI